MVFFLPFNIARHRGLSRGFLSGFLFQHIVPSSDDLFQHKGLSPLSLPINPRLWELTSHEDFCNDSDPKFFGFFP